MTTAVATKTAKPSKPPAPARQAATRITTVDEALRVADVVMASGSYPKDANKFKIAMMLLAGADVGFGVSQSLSYITPPLNGKCSIYGDGGLALVRQSGLLEVFEEGVSGQGDEREAWVRIKRAGYPEKTFRYPLSLAKTLHSYKKAHEIDPKTKGPKGGQWYDDTDNMLGWRARWRAWRTEFADVLCGLGGAEEEQEEAVAVTVVTAPPAALPPASPPPALNAPPPVVVDGQPVATAEQLEEITRLRGLIRENEPDANKQKAEWAAFLAPFHVETAKQLTPDQAAQFIRAVGEKYDPFTYPSPSETAA